MKENKKTKNKNKVKKNLSKSLFKPSFSSFKEVVAKAFKISPKIK